MDKLPRMPTLVVARRLLKRISMSKASSQVSLPTVVVGALILLACGGAGNADPSTSAGAGAPGGGGAGASAMGGASTAGGTGDSADAGNGSAGEANGGAQTAAGGTSGAAAGGTSGAAASGAGGSAGGAGSAASLPGAGLDCGSNGGSPACALGLLATRPCSSGPRASACVCMAPCHRAADCGGASCVDIALTSGATGSVCPPPSYTCAVP